MPSSEPIASRRGYHITDLSHATVSYVFIRADAAEAARAVAEATGGEASDASPPNPIPDEVKQWRGRLLYQFKGHPWSMFMGSYDDHKTLAAKVSADSGLEVLSFCMEDTSGWSEVVVHRDGLEVEKLSWGLDYSEEMEEMEGEEVPDEAAAGTSEWDAEAKVLTDAEMEMSDQYLFRSKLRDVGVEDLQRGEGFVDDLFRYHDAWLMDLDEQPESNDETDGLRPGKAGLDALAGVWAVAPKSG